MAESAGVMRGGVIVANVLVRVLKSEKHSLKSQVTRYPVESKNSIADHVILDPNVVTVSFEMPNSNGGAEKARDVFQQFVKMRDQRIPIDLDTEHGRYKNMVISSFSPDHSAPNKGAFSATLQLEQVGVVGVSEMVSASGGRPTEILRQDGTQATACNAQFCGMVPAISGGVPMNRCLTQLASQGVGREFA